MAEHTCTTCHGNKTVPCIRCGGDGKLQGETCYYCNGTGETSCPACEGTGKVSD